jgi:tRNA modification GTPase
MHISKFYDINDNFRWHIKETVEKNIEANGGYMTDEWCYSVTGQDLYDIRNLMKYDIISAKKPEDIEDLKHDIRYNTRTPKIDGNTVLVTNLRHYEALMHAKESFEQVKNGMETNISADLLAQDLRQALFYIGSITGEVTNSEVLGTIFSRFCIGK